jgi:Icc-related predicted phosphoesterase
MKVFFASDVHGSTTCFRKLVNSGEFYKADVVIMGGDLAGKSLVPLVASGSGWTASYGGASFELDTGEEAAEFERRVAMVGGYTSRVGNETVEEWRSNQDLVESTLRHLILERTEEMVALAAERLSGTGRRLLIGLGNDDFDEMIPLLDSGSVGYACDGLVDLGGGLSLASLGWSNETPWKTNRECSEDELSSKLDHVLERADPSSTIFNIHVPPYASGLDLAPRLDSSLQIKLAGGEPDMVPVGSTAVAQTIARFQPLASLHGHIHEGRGMARIGRTTVVNPGSEYDQGSLLGAIIDVNRNKKVHCQLVSG